MARAEPNPEHVAAGVALLREGMALAEVKAQVKQRFALDGNAARTVALTAVVEAIGDLPTGDVERWLAETTRQAEQCRNAAERNRIEAKLMDVWNNFDLLMEDDVPPSKVIEAARKLDKLLHLGWARRLSPGCL